jgi:hypothetical protein
MNTVQTPQPNTQYYNPADGNTYTTKQQDPSGKGTVMVNTQTQEEQLLPNPSMQEVQMNNGVQSLKPIMKTQTLGASMEKDIDHLVNGEDLDDTHEGVHETSPEDVLPEVQDMLRTDIDHAIRDIERESQGIDGDIQEIVDDAQMFNEVAPAMGDDTATVIDGVELPGGDVHTTDVPLDGSDEEGHEDHKNPHVLASTSAPIPVQSTPKRWMDIRAGITTRGDVDFKERQLTHLRNAGLAHLAAGLGFSPDKRDADATGRSEQGIPIASPSKEKSMQIGLTEFPKGEKRDDSVGLDTGKGYNVPMKTMDENQVANREKFDNEHRQYIRSMTIRQLRELLGGGGPVVKAIESGKGLQPEREPGKVEKNDQYEGIEADAIARAVGLQAVAIDLAPPSPEDVNAPAPKPAPVVHKTLKKAPGVEGYEEPGVIQPAAKNIKVLLDQFEQHYQKLQELKDQLAKATEPHQQAVMQEQAKALPGIQEQDKLLKTVLEMVYEAIAATEDGLVHYHEELWAVVSRTKDVIPAVTVSQLIAEAKLIDQHLAERIDKLVKVLQDRSKSRIEERTLYEFPPSKEHEKRMQPEASMKAVAELNLDVLGDILKDFLFVASEISEARKALQQ